MFEILEMSRCGLKDSTAGSGFAEMATVTACSVDHVNSIYSLKSAPGGAPPTAKQGFRSYQSMSVHFLTRQVSRWVYTQPRFCNPG
jgi:hypothetical protein